MITSAPPVARRNATLVSADAAGYSRLMATDELATIRAITQYREAGERVAREHGGRLVDSPGDNLLFEFGRPVDALQAGMTFQATVLALNAGLNEHERMMFRIGMHSGEVVVEGDRIYGSGINVAARLERLARPGGICISDLVREQIPEPPPLEDIGQQHVKNIPYPVHAWFVDVPGQVHAESHRHLAAWPTLAVLPFDIAGGDADREYLADGICEELITTLAMWRQFPVIARNSAFTYKGRAIDPKTVGRELEAGYLVVGSVRQAGSRVRIAAELLETQTGHHLWADRWNTAIEDVFETQAEIAQAIAVAMRPELLKAESDRAMRQAPADLNAWDYALRGLWHLYRSNRENGDQAVTLLTRAVELDPDFGFAQAHLAHAHYRMLQHQWTTTPAETVGHLIASAERAVSCDPLDANGHLYRALASSVQGKLDEALVALRRSVELNPSLPAARSLYGQFLGMAGQYEEGLKQLDRAIWLSPRDPSLWSFHAGKAGVLFMAGRDADAREAAERAVAIDPDAMPAYSTIAATSAFLGDMDRARAAVAEMNRIQPRMSMESVRAYMASAPPEVTARILEGLHLAGFEFLDELSSAPQEGS
ncbi:MAG: tetratricopeptide repeat protein [Candidatus Limnocylindrales bacterium]